MSDNSIDDQGYEIIDYVACPTGLAFHNDNESFVKGIRGPVGSSKSVTCIWEILKRSQEQKPFNGVRRTRWVAVRNTFSQLHSTVLKSWREWVPEHVCPIKQTPLLTAHMIQKMGDGTTMDMEVLFLALDNEDDMKKLLSLELTGAWINEAREIPKAILDGVTQRVRRYPSMRQGGPSWSGVIMDTNPPDTGHWWYKLFEQQLPPKHRQFIQPPALFSHIQDNGSTIYMPNPAAENIKNLPTGHGYYLDMIAGKDEEWIKVYVLNQYGTVVDGRPVYPEFVDTLHTSTVPLEPHTQLPIIVSYDFGNTPACVFSQISPLGQFKVLDELCCIDPEGDEFTSSIKTFIEEQYRPFVANKYHGAKFIHYCDPAGMQKAQTDAKTCVQIMNECGIQVNPAGTGNRFLPRREAVVRYMKMKDGEGNEAFQMSPTCLYLREGFLGRYCMRKIKTSASDTRYREEPDKTKWSHVHDALQYGALGVSLGAGMQFEKTTRGGGSGVRREIKVKKWM